MEGIGNASAEGESVPATNSTADLSDDGHELQGGERTTFIYQGAPVFVIGRSRGSNAAISFQLGNEAGRLRTLTLHGFLSMCCASLFGCCMIATMIVGVLGPCAVCFVYGYAWVVWLTHMTDECDEHLDAWLGAYLICSVLTWACRKPLVQFLCRWNLDELRTGARPPRRIRSLGFLNVAAHFAWMLFGRSLLKASHTCKETSHDLFSFVQWFSVLGSCFYGPLLLWLLVGAAGNRILLCMARRGMLHWAARRDLLYHRAGASPETFNDMEVVAYDADMFADPLDQDDSRPQGECCICLEPYDDKKEIKRTSCGHMMHSECLEIWLRAARTCPTCRSDLEANAVTSPSEATSSV